MREKSSIFACWRVPVACGLLGLACAAARGDELAAARTTTVALASSVLPSYYGKLRMDYEFRTLDGASDSDAYGYGSIGARNLEGGLVDFYLSGRLHQDLDGHSRSNGTFRSLDDARGGAGAALAGSLS